MDSKLIREADDSIKPGASAPGKEPTKQIKLAKRAIEMSEDNDAQQTSISNARSIEEIGEYWDSHSLADHWDQTREVEFEIRAPHRITLDPEVYVRLEEQAESRGVSLATLANAWLKEKLSGDKAA